METVMSLLVGVGLSAACGFRVFVPLLVASVAARTGHLRLAGGFEWMGSDTALIAFALATAREVAAYYIPWLDNFLDGLAGPAAVVAGTLVTASLVTDMSPFLKWTVAVIAGGGAAGLVKGTTTVTRGLSTLTTAGLGNPILATAELGGALITSVLAVLVPVLAALVVIALLTWLGRRRRWRRRAALEPARG
jgi:hypothetical protein